MEVFFKFTHFNTFQLLALQETVELLQSELKETQLELHGAKAEIFELKKEDQKIIGALQSQQTFHMSE